MRPPHRLPLAFALAFVAVLTLGACGDLVDEQADDLSSEAGDPPLGDGQLNGAVMDPPLAVGSVALPEVTGDADGGPFTFSAPEGGLLAVYFGYLSCPDVCPTTMADLSVALEDLGPEAERVSVAMVSVDPDRDTPERLDDYLNHFFDRYHGMVTHDADALTQAEEAFLASSTIEPHEPGEPYEVSHTARVAVVDDEGMVRVQWPFGTTADAMTSDLRTLLDETREREPRESTSLPYPQERP